MNGRQQIPRLCGVRYHRSRSFTRCAQALAMGPWKRGHARLGKLKLQQQCTGPKKGAGWSRTGKATVTTRNGPGARHPGNWTHSPSSHQGTNRRVGAEVYRQGLHERVSRGRPQRIIRAMCRETRASPDHSVSRGRKPIERLTWRVPPTDSRIARPPNARLCKKGHTLIGVCTHQTGGLKETCMHRLRGRDPLDHHSRQKN